MSADAPSVLIVEDERIVAKDLQAELAAMGYDASAIAASADEAIAAASARCPDLVLMDIRIAGTLDGIDTAHLLRARFGVALVYLTAHADEATLERAKTTEPHGYLLKPVRTAELRSTIEMALHKHAQERKQRDHARSFATTLARRLETTDRMAALGTLAAGVAHEVNNPLSVVVANAAYVADELVRVREEHGAEAAVDEAITAQGELLGAADRIARIVGDLREFAKPPQEGEARTDPASAIARAVRTTAAQLRERARVVTAIEPGLPMVVGDEARLAQVLVNLMVNAGQAIAPGDAKQQTVHVRARLGGGSVELEVADSGGGVAPDVLARMFEPFFTTGGGAGLGLAVCHGIVTSLGGEITATSVVGHGTTVRVRLPAAPAQVVRPSAAPVPRARVLVIDDEDAVLRALVRMLREHEVVTACSGAEALAVLASQREFDVIFTDVTMPDMTGIELYRELRATRPADAERVVFVTGGALTADVRDFLAVVPNDHVEKPVRGATLDALIAKRLLAIPTSSPA